MTPRKPKKSAQGGARVIPFRLDAAFFFERGVYYLDRFNLPNALKYFRKTVEYEPENPINHCNLAGVLSELGQYEESNKVLEHVLHDLDSEMHECHFYIANNWANLGQYDLAEENVVKYLELEPRGEFVEDAEEMLDILVHEFGGGEVLRQREVERRESPAEEDLARRLLEEGHFMEASLQLEKLIEEEPDSTAPRNNLSLAYYYMGQLDRAIEISQEVLRKDPTNVHATCNLAVFYQHLDNHEELGKILAFLRKLYPIHYDQAYKLATTMGILGEHETAYRLFRHLSRWSHRSDHVVLHCVAAAAFNTGRYRQATNVWEEVRETDLHPEVAEYYLGLVKAAAAGDRNTHTVSYHYQLPFHEQFKALKVKLESGNLGDWKHDPLFRSSLFWALRHGDYDTKAQVIETFSLIADRDTEAALEDFIQRTEEPAPLQLLAQEILFKIRGERPIVAWSILEQAKEQMQHMDNQGQGSKAAEQIWHQYMERCHGQIPRIQNQALWVASLLYVVSEELGLGLTQQGLAQRFSVSVSGISRVSRMIRVRS